MSPALEGTWEMSTVIRHPPGGVSAAARRLGTRTRLPPLLQQAAESLGTFPAQVLPQLAQPPRSLWQEQSAGLLAASEPLHCAATDCASGGGAGPAP